jgi:hypothetical protein
MWLGYAGERSQMRRAVGVRVLLYSDLEHRARVYTYRTDEMTGIWRRKGRAFPGDALLGCFLGLLPSSFSSLRDRLLPKGLDCCGKHQTSYQSRQTMCSLHIRSCRPLRHETLVLSSAVPGPFPFLFTLHTRCREKLRRRRECATSCRSPVPSQKKQRGSTKMQNILYDYASNTLNLSPPHG